MQGPEGGDLASGDPARRPGLPAGSGAAAVLAGVPTRLASRTVTALGTHANEVALLVQAKQLTGSPLAVGLLGVVELVPLLVFGLNSRPRGPVDRRALMRWCEAVLAGCAGPLLVNALLPHPALWPLYAVTTVMMAATALQRPSFDASLPRLVQRGSSPPRRRCFRCRRTRASCLVPLLAGC